MNAARLPEAGRGAKGKFEQRPGTNYYLCACTKKAYFSDTEFPMRRNERSEFFLRVINPRLKELGARMCNASFAEDAVLGETAYQDMLRFYEEERSQGFWHPAFTESVADFTSDDREAVTYYRRALAEAHELDEPTHSILICMARRLHDIGDREQAEACLRDGRAEAIKLQASDFIAEADGLAKEWSSDPSAS